MWLMENGREIVYKECQVTYINKVYILRKTVRHSKDRSSNLTYLQCFTWNKHPSSLSSTPTYSRAVQVKVHMPSGHLQATLLLRFCEQGHSRNPISIGHIRPRDTVIRVVCQLLQLLPVLLVVILDTNRRHWDHKLATHPHLPHKVSFPHSRALPWTAAPLNRTTKKMAAVTRCMLCFWAHWTGAKRWRR